MSFTLQPLPRQDLRNRWRHRLEMPCSESRHLLEIDHIQPRALGGSNALENFRVLCRTHNLLMAERSFGRQKIESFRRRNDSADKHARELLEVRVNHSTG